MRVSASACVCMRALELDYGIEPRVVWMRVFIWRFDFGVSTCAAAAAPRLSCPCTTSGRFGMPNLQGRLHAAVSFINSAHQAHDRLGVCV